MRQLLKQRESYYYEYIKAQNKNKNLEKHRNMFGYFNFQVVAEIEKAIQNENQLVNKNFYSFARKGADLTYGLHTIWTKLSENLSSLK